jgi:hypothetical protein
LGCEPAIGYRLGDEFLWGVVLKDLVADEALMYHRKKMQEEELFWRGEEPDPMDTCKNCFCIYLATEFDNTKLCQFCLLQLNAKWM